jgi:DNA repair protein SbcC/Rad50
VFSVFGNKAPGGVFATRGERLLPGASDRNPGLSGDADMIPLRVQLKGFLCYKEQQEVSFDGAALWMLAGLNGSGKSTVFDAVTYALFGHHRGGGHDAHELINKDSDRASVAFEFSLDGERYQVHRTLQRTRQAKSKATQQIYRWSPLDSWEALEGTNLRAGFDEWVEQNIGLSYETFTSSVLLLQGKAEKLLDSTAKGRFEVLAGIVDLGRYENLHRRADEQRKDLEARVKTLTHRLAALPEVSAVALIEAEGRIEQAEAARQKAQEEVERMQALEFQAREWARLQERLAGVRRRLDESERLLARAPEIEKAAARLRELCDVLPRLQTVIEQRQQIATSEHQTEELLRQKEQAAAKLAGQDGALAQARQKRADLQRQLAEDEARRETVSADLRKVTALVEKLKEYERQEADLARLEEELGRLPSDPARAVGKAREAHDALAALAQVLPQLGRLQSLREELRQATAREKSAGEARQTIQKRGEQLKEAVERLKPELAEAERARQEADEEATRARTLQQQVHEALRELHLLRAAKVCRHCGQKLTPGHVQEEKERRTREAAAADERFKKAAARQKAAREAERQARLDLETTDRQLREAREHFVKEKTEADQARKEVERLQRDCAQVYADLPEPYRTRVSPALPAGWLDTSYPSPAELAQAREQAAGLDAARRCLREAEEALRTWGEHKARAGAFRQNLARMQAELPADRPGVRQQHVRLEADEKALQGSIEARRREAAAAQREMDRLGKEREQTQGALAQIDGKLHTEEATRQHGRQVLDRALKDLPAAWQAQAETAGTADVHRLRGERDELARQQPEEASRQLQQARASLQMLHEEQETLRGQEGQFPPEARQAPAELQKLLRQARQAYDGRDEALSQTRQEKALLEQQHEQRRELQQEYLTADEELNQARLLAELLGRDRLQLHLVRQAERQVVDHANAVLDRLSGGQLYLRLAGEAGGEGNTAKALELEAHNRVTGEKPINVAFLSGSQKFRVAVSLALGIGQYASRRHRPIESVIIDEGFGCLDRHGRQVMIQELHNLRGQLRCILLVSHQEEFAEAFADGYHFEMQGGTTVVQRFQR